MSRPDIAIVGAGIAGGAMATVLARAGLDVVLLERQVEYRDRIRGETMFPWGVAEVLQLGLEDVLLGAGGGYASSLALYDELQVAEGAEPLALPLEGIVPGVRGQLNVGHPQACEALAQAAARDGARVVRGVGDVTVTPGTAPRLTFSCAGVTEDVAPRLVVGADGRTSAVRRVCGLELQETRPRVMLAGYLASGMSGWPEASNCMTVEGDSFVLTFPRPGGLMRVYLAYSIDEKQRFTGPEKVSEFTKTVSGLASIPHARGFAASQPEGPVGAYPMTHSWLDEPFVPGVVFAGDAAGWSDPTIGQGLSVAMRDVRVLSEILREEKPWDFRPYAEEREERMRRLGVALEVTMAIRCDFSDRGRARRAAFNESLGDDPRFLQVLLVTVIGPASVPEEAVTDEVVELVRSFGA